MMKNSNESFLPLSKLAFGFIISLQGTFKKSKINFSEIDLEKIS